MIEKINIAVSVSKKEDKPGAWSKWKNKAESWGSLVERLQAPVITGETLAEYAAAPKEKRAELKDVGGFVGGTLLRGSRKLKSVLSRSVVTLDADYPGTDFWSKCVALSDCAMVCHSTHSSTEQQLRLRLIIPLSKEVTPEQYVPISRRLAGLIGISDFDNTTFDVNRFMYYPSVSKDAEYYFEEQKGLFLNPDAILNTFTDWRNVSEWDVSKDYINKLRDKKSRVQDPESKKGLIGLFCRAYPIQTAITELLSDVYTPTDAPDRFTYTKGSAVGGLVVYEELHAFSHHGTDPASGMLCNSFDLVRLQKFGHLDTSEKDDVTKLRSYKEMLGYASTDKRVALLLAEERKTHRGVFEEITKPEFPPGLTASATDKKTALPTAPPAPETTEVEDSEWETELVKDKKGLCMPTAHNLNLIFKHDPELKVNFQYNEFEETVYIARGVQWRKDSKNEALCKDDRKCLENYIEVVYGVTAQRKIDNSLTLAYRRNSYHPIKQYLNGVVWDGTPRLDTILVRCFGAEDNIYTRAAARKFFTGAAARVFTPGIKFDLTLALVGACQGKGKSTFLQKIGLGYTTDSLNTFSGNVAADQLRGSWIVEIAELAALARSSIEEAKKFLTQVSDRYRRAYDDNTRDYKRQCVFAITTNDFEFLKDPTGNRRFLPVGVRPAYIDLSVHDEEFETMIPQLWAEAVQLFKRGEKLYLDDPLVARLAHFEQKGHTVRDVREGEIERFLTLPLPELETWDSWGVPQRQAYFNDKSAQKNHSRLRSDFCISELVYECFGEGYSNNKKKTAAEVSHLLKKLEYVEHTGLVKLFINPYGRQRYYKVHQDHEALKSEY